MLKVQPHHHKEENSQELSEHAPPTPLPGENISKSDSLLSVSSLVNDIWFFRTSMSEVLFYKEHSSFNSYTHSHKLCHTFTGSLICFSRVSVLPSGILSLSSDIALPTGFFGDWTRLLPPLLLLGVLPGVLEKSLKENNVRIFHLIYFCAIPLCVQ